MSEPFRLRGLTAEIPVASPLFTGHFPGHPILPGVAQLAIVGQALGAPLTRLKGIKLRRPVGPGDVLELSFGDPDEDGWIRFEMRREGATGSSGSVSVSGETAPPPSPIESPYSAIENLLPHAPPARLIRGIVETSPEGIVAVADIPAGHPLAENALLGIEAAAQAAAVLEALQRTDAPGPRIGYLVGIREAWLTGALPVNRPFRVAARLQGGAPPLSIYEIDVGDARVGTISTYVATRGE